MSRKRQENPFPLEGGQVFGPQTIRETVIVWQGDGVALLNEHLGVPGSDFTEDTRQAVLEVQRKGRGLEETGLVDKATWGRIVP